MTVAELIDRFRTIPKDSQIMILDGSNGGGVPREINTGPSFHVVEAWDADETADCENLVGTTVVVLGYGCY